MSPEHKPATSNVAALASSNARQLAGIIIGLLSTAISIGVGYVINRTTTEYRLSDLTATVGTMKSDVEDMKLNGHADHEKRIAKLENQKGDQTSDNLSRLSATVASLAESVSKDHDSIIRILTLLEKRDAANEPK